VASSTRIGRYEILRPLGRGAMGLVYLARDPQIERELALKTVRFDGPAGSFNLEESKARFLKEARISGRLQHPHIVTVFDVGEDEGTLYLAMEYVSGGSLSQRIAKPEPLSVEDRIRIVAEVALALGHAHERGVIHRDIKPANILLTPTLSAKVTDFGIGKLLVGDTDLTSTGQMVGSPSYMSPEQIKGEKLDVRSDIFSLGVVLYQILTDRKPFPADTLTTLVYQILHEEPPEPGVIRSDLPPELSGILHRCLAKHRDERYADAFELATDLSASIGLAPETGTGIFSDSMTRRRPGARGSVGPVPSSGGMQGPVDEEPTLASGPHKAPGAPATVAPVTTEGSGQRPIESSKVQTSVTTGPTSKLAQTTGGGGLSNLPKVPLIAAGGGLLLVLLIWMMVGGKKKDENGGPAGPGGPVRRPVVTQPTPVLTPTPALPTPVPALGTPGVGTPPPEGTPGALVPPLALGTQTAGSPPPTKPPKKPTVTPTFTPTVPPTPTPKPADFTYSVRKLVKIDVVPDQARVFLDKEYIGIVDDWDDAAGGALVSLTPGAHHLRLSYPGYRDMTVDVNVIPNAAEEKVTIKQKMVPGTPGSEWPGPAGTFKRPDYKTIGPVRLEIEPYDAQVLVNGRDFSPASKWAGTDLTFPKLAVYEVKLAAPGYEPKTLRVLVSPSTGKDRTIIKEKLKKQ